MYYHTSFHDHVYIVTSVKSTSQIMRPPCCYCWSWEIKEMWGWNDLRWHNAHTKFREDWSSGSEVERGTHRQHGVFIRQVFNLRKESMLEKRVERSILTSYFGIWLCSVVFFFFCENGIRRAKVFWLHGITYASVVRIWATFMEMPLYKIWFLWSHLEIKVAWLLSV
jgi:hypothetical protein